MDPGLSLLLYVAAWRGVDTFGSSHFSEVVAFKLVVIWLFVPVVSFAIITWRGRVHRREFEKKPQKGVSRLLRLF